MRSFGDSNATRDAIYENVLKAAQGIQPVSNTRYSLALTNPHWADREDVSISDRKKAILRGETLNRRLRGTWQLKDAQGAMIGERLATVAHVPRMTNQGTFVVNGSEYTLGHQMRLRPGVFTRRKENGELESHINIMPGKGLSHHYFLEPETGIFKIRVGQANMPLISVMKAMGATDKEIQASWGNELHAINMQKDDPKVIDKLYARLAGKKGNPQATLEEKREAVARTFNEMELDPEVTKRTLGQPFSKLSKDVALATTRKLLDVSRSKADTDDRDALAFQHFMGPEDLFAERIGRDKHVLNDALWKASTHGNLDKLPTGAFTKNIHAALLDSGLGQSLEEINPADVFDQQTRVSRLGYGGIPSIDSVPDEARSVQPSHLGFIDLLRTPESFKVGVDSRVSHVAKKGSDGRIYTPFLDPKSGQMIYRSPQDVADLKVAFPGELQKGKPLVAAMVGGKTSYIPRDQVDLSMPHAEHWFSPINNMVPMKSAVKGQRAAMASRFLTQALPVKDAESPFVRGQVPGSVGRSFEEHYGHQVGAVFSEQQAGRVSKITPDSITVKYQDGSTKEHELYNNFPYNRKTYIHNTATVQAGDPVKPGQLLAKSNYTDDKGHVALGKNMRVAYVPFRGLNYEDAYVISESAAHRLSSEHMYQHSLEWDEKHRKGLNSFISIFPGVFDKKQFGGMDTDGIVKPGTVIKPGDPLILAARERELSRKQVHAAHKGSFVDESLTWDHHTEGVVTDVEKTDKGVTVAVKSLNRMQVGDKMSGRYGDKGVVADVIPDDQMPHDNQGRPFEVLANPLGIISRYNPAQMIEATLGAISEKTGKPYTIDDFSNIKDLNEYAINERQKHGVNNYTSIHDPGTDKKIDNVFTGNRFFMKLHHTSESKGQGRGLGGYTSEGMPAKGGAEGSKRMALMDVNAMLSHGAIETLRDAKLIRGQKNQEYWSHFMQGNRPPTPRVPIVYEKFINQLRASGVNVERRGSQTNLMELTDKNVNEMAGDRELQNVETVDWKTGLAPIKGGLFDEKLTGGHNGNRWAKITLHEPMPNPVMEEPIRRMLDLTKDKFEQVLSGREELGGKKGPQAIQQALANINVPKAIQQARADIASGKKTLRDNAMRKLQFLKATDMKGIHPKDWMMNQVPVIPPMFRPVSVMQQTGGRIVGDANYLYKEVFDANNALRKMSAISEDAGDERLNLYNAFRGVTGLGDPIHPKNQEKKIKGFLQHVFGSSPKFGTVQQKLIGTTVDLVGRAVVVPNPDLNMDEVGLPESRAWEVYTPFIARRLIKKGVPHVQALEYIKNKHDVAKKAMLEEINERPVIVTRAPTLHRYGLMAFWPKLTKGDTLQISPIVVGGFGMDFDGDASNYHVPATDESRDEVVHKLLPSKNLLNPSKFQAHYLPRQEYVGGLFNATKVNSEKKPRVFATKQDALRALQNGEIHGDHPIHVVQGEK
jgi:DNA-directed RNA polymerase subunit beta